MILPQLTLLALLQAPGSQGPAPDTLVVPVATPALAAHDLDTGNWTAAQAELLGLVPLQPTGGATGPILTLIGSAGPGAYLVQIQNTPTAFAEEFLIQLPPAPSMAHPSPLLVAFHKFGSTVQDIPVNTDLEQECWNRNWFLVAPLGASTKSFSSIASQLNTELVIELVVDHFRGYIDTERIYGIGFSMGGGNALNYAARHLDPARPMFAAIVNHSGPVSLRDSYSAAPASQFIMELWFGGPPNDYPFEYARSSTLDLYDLDAQDSSTGNGAPSAPPGPGGPGGPGGSTGGTTGGVPTQTPPNLALNSKRSLIGNLAHVPLYLVRAKFDPLLHVRYQLDELAKHLSESGAPHVYKVIGGILVHKWSTLNETQALNWLSNYRLKLPQTAHTLADRDARYFHFDVEQEESGQFTPFDWEIRRGINRIQLLETSNLKRISLNLASAGLDASRALRVNLTTSDGRGDELRISGYGTAPANVLRDGIPAANWIFESSTGVLTLSEQDGARPHQWVIEPKNPIPAPREGR